MTYFTLHLSSIDPTEDCNADFDCCVKQNRETASSIIISSSVMIGFTLFLLPVLVCMTANATRLVWPDDKQLPLILCMLSFSLLVLIGFYICLIITKLDPYWCCGEARSCNCFASFFTRLPYLFLTNAILLNLNKWIQYYLKIRANVGVFNGEKANDKSVDTLSEFGSNHHSESQVPPDHTADLSTFDPTLHEITKLRRR